MTAAVAGTPAHGAAVSNVKFDLKNSAMKADRAAGPAADLRAVFFDGDDWAPVVVEPMRGDSLPMTASESLSRAVATTGTPQVRIDLNLQPLAGHRSFDTMSTRRATLGWVLTNNGNALGVGTTGTYGIRLAKAWRFTPFVSIDYNHIDSARYVDSTGPRAFMVNNADTGFTGTMGATVSHRFGAERRFRAVAYGAMIAATDTGGQPREFGSVGARLVHALGNSGVEAMWEELGMGLDYRLTPRARVSGALVQTIDRRDGEATAAKFGLRVAL
ncbi:autotransporter outer membrane beta-barrel domain-containing protein [Sphingomonas sp. SUN039]|uniref:autotransporter outer membrane beta-barrel domain-containing protein n=1 Tax=Sphingomonas sp. SUN039 TaxID=2937787 RepID=UPI002164B46A|nr:autotransporter outer membrane beta-barrel domain-containing protein [Sphingomonas sp. SUN039]UVO55652.1 autotransporter outer membrane beta-barrel domain-containing protein [Sphingomonas sp. SUN039]